MRYAITLSSLRKINEPIDKEIERLLSQGYDAVEMYGDPHEARVRSIKETLNSYDMAVCGVTGMWGTITENGWKRSLTSTNTDILKHTCKYVKDCIEMCREFGGHEMNICLVSSEELSGFDSTHDMLMTEQKERMTRKLMPTLIGLIEVAKDRDVKLLLEPLNRYVSPYCTTALDAVNIAKQVNLDNFGILLDTFHMNIEEDSIGIAISISAGWLEHMHFADNNRKMPGFGHIDFRSVLDGLAKISYNKFIGFEPNLSQIDYELPTKKGLDFIKSIEGKESQE
jgi:sugar phosphate isomerase/epimerase